MAVIFTVAPAPPTLPASAMLPLLVVCNVTDPPDATVTGPDAVRLFALVILTVVLPPVTAPVSAVPHVVTLSVLVPSVIVLPLAE